MRGIATGDNNQPYVATDAGFKEFNYEADLIYYPPCVPELGSQVVATVEETRWDEPLADMLRVRFGKNMPTVLDDKDPERDVVNFPRYKPVTYPEATRFVIIPDNWFRALYPKTGVTGPYALTLGFVAFLVSKEWLIMDHEMVVGFSLAMICTYVFKKWGTLGSRYLEGMRDSEDYYWNRYQQDSIHFLNKFIEQETFNRKAYLEQDILFDAKKENVHLQREAEYRRRLMDIYSEVKRKLDYQIATQNEQKAFAQRHMVKWILEAVNKGVFQINEKDTLNKCITDLKALAQSRAGSI